MKQPFFSIVIATYNSQRTLEYTLQSIKGQTIDPEELEIIVVDGGSTDDTRTIAGKYGATILDNPKRLPEYAKAIGTGRARGHFVMRMDSDEEFSYPGQLRDKMYYLKKYPDVRMLISNQIVSGRPEICGISADYMNILGDPFSYFVYKTKKDKYNTYRHNVVMEDGEFALMRFEKGDVYPLADSATCALSLDYIRQRYPGEYDTIEFTCGAYDRVLSDTKLCGVIRKDVIYHNCSSSFRTYLSKLRFRVINNLFHKEESGFSAKQGISEELQRRKKLFCLYALLVPLPVLDSVRLALVHKNGSFLLHFVYLYYVCFQIARFGLVKLFGGERKNKSYGK